VHFRPSQDVIAAYSDKVRFRARRQHRYANLRPQPAVTKDGVRIAMNINAGLLVDLPHLAESGADGIGLFRTELEFMVAARFPMKDQQTRIYRQILDAAGDKPVVFRSLDIGGDKLLPYFRHEKEENPAMGWRAVRMTLDQSGLFRSQIRALLRAAEGRELRVMLPMVSQLAEYEKARNLVGQELEVARRFGWKGTPRFHLGAMVEVPALLWQLDRLFELVDFVSVGSNDLVQFLYAADRNNRRLAGRYDPLSPPILRALGAITGAARRHGKPLALCGELAGRPLEAMALIGLGFRSISMAPANVGPVKAMIQSLNAGRVAELIGRLIGEDDVDVRRELSKFAKAEGIELD
jgi:phosphotransferase system enzyme I (PtsP)